MFIGLSVSPLFAQPYQGEVSGVWRNDVGNIPVIGNITLAAGDTLIVESGVSVFFQGNYSFIINGTLIADGTEEEPIIFRSNRVGAGQWLGIKFTSRNSSGSRMGFCQVLYANKGVECESSAAPLVHHSLISSTASYGIDLDDSNARIEDCTITTTGNSGIRIAGNSIPTILNCDISDCTGNGIASGSSARPTIRGNHITGVNRGINTQSSGSTIEDNYLTNCREIGIYLQDASGSNVRRNIIEAARGSYGVQIHRSTGTVLSDNNIMNSSGDGLFIYSSNSVIVSNNIIASSSGDGITVQQSNPIMLYNNVWNSGNNDYDGLNAGNNDVSVNPMLDQNYLPRADSDMIDAGDPQSGVDPDGTRNDIGALFYNQNIAPTIIEWEPEELELVDGAQTIQFTVTAIDSNDHQLIYNWYVNDNLRRQHVVPEFEYRFDTEGVYVVRVDVDDRFYMGVTSHIWEFSMDAPVRNEIQPSAFNLSSVYPNPFNSIGRFHVSGSGYAHLKVWDVNGRLVEIIWNGQLSSGRNSFSIDAGSFPTGEYILSAESEAGLITRKFVIIK